MKNLLIEIRDEILFLTVNRPDKLNALSVEVLNELKSLLGDLPPGIRGIIFTGAGEKAFIAGADISAMEKMNAEEGYLFSQLGQEVSLLLESISVPVIACVNGFALGGGCEMAMACDFIYATSNAIFGQPEVNIALIPAFGGTQRLIRLVGLSRAKEMIYTGRSIKIEEALQIGLVLRSFSTKEEMIKSAMATFDLIKSKSPLVIKKCKQVMSWDESLPNGLLREREGFKWVFESEDKKEGLKAFLEKRKANFIGR